MVDNVGRRAAHVTLHGWEMPTPGLPEMTVPSKEELAEGYKGELWTATKADWKLEVQWLGDKAKFFCRAMRLSDLKDPVDSVAFDYPHEVIEWLGIWAKQLARR